MHEARSRACWKTSSATYRTMVCSKNDLVWIKHVVSEVRVSNSEPLRTYAATVASVACAEIPSVMRWRITVNRACVMLSCRSSMICMLFDGIITHRSHNSGIFPPLNPVSPIVIAPDWRATSSASRTLREHPLPLIPKAISPS